jgi:hypothetical protein
MIFLRNTDKLARIFRVLRAGLSARICGFLYASFAFAIFSLPGSLSSESLRDGQALDLPPEFHFEAVESVFGFDQISEETEIPMVTWEESTTMFGFSRDSESRSSDSAISGSETAKVTESVKVSRNQIQRSSESSGDLSSQVEIAFSGKASVSYPYSFSPSLSSPSALYLFGISQLGSPWQRASASEGKTPAVGRGGEFRERILPVFTEGRSRTPQFFQSLLALYSFDLQIENRMILLPGQGKGFYSTLGEESVSDSVDQTGHLVRSLVPIRAHGHRGIANMHKASLPSLPVSSIDYLVYKNFLSREIRSGKIKEGQVTEVVTAFLGKERSGFIPVLAGRICLGTDRFPRQAQELPRKIKSLVRPRLVSSASLS